ncbi:MAG: hypothetical protein V7K71_16350 [Nostoc sp.]|uniref:hypothetical protein n=1 Tax=Nostoc sp. TaxID=1180 RepID=UPI002FF45FCD
MATPTKGTRPDFSPRLSKPCAGEQRGRGKKQGTLNSSTSEPAPLHFKLVKNAGRGIRLI